MGVIKKAGSIPTIEIEIFQKEDAFFPSPYDREMQQKQFLIDAFKMHYLNNMTYKAFCDHKGIGIRDIEENHRNIPLIPSTVFKTKSIRTESGEDTVKTCFSSGTQGIASTVERDNTTLERFLGSVRNAIDHVYGVEDAIVFNLGPSAEEAKDIWFSYVMSVSDLVFPTLDYVQNGIFRMDALINDMEKYKNEYQDIMLIGAPPMLVEFFKYLKKEGISIDYGQKIFAITAGGWKKQELQSLSRDEFSKNCMDILQGIQKQRIRDAFNMVELNTVIPECECGSKHVPLWLDAFVIDLDTYERVSGEGSFGLLCFLDASPTSYPGFIMSGDLGKITYVDNCPCGRNGVCIDIVRRVNTIESRGCALKIEKEYLER
ncbi:MAG: hypothetical protein N2645_08320 [Clostridia bacterium]|nr:hypothetical protein [Clostridia bacterium]